MVKLTEGLLRQILAEPGNWPWGTLAGIRVAVLAIILAIGLGNCRWFKRLNSCCASLGENPAAAIEIAGGCSAPWPLVSILVPARDEEHNIRRCVLSLLAQDYPAFEVVALDDDSTDETLAILQELAATDSRLRVVRGRPLPPDWLGKHWACEQLAHLARGELLLFTDADTWHHPDTLRDAVSARAREDCDLLTGIPREEIGSWGERLVMPVVGWALFSLVPLRLVGSRRRFSLTMAIGQFMLFRRESFESIGGYAAVCADPMDDLALARRLKERGFRQCFFDLSQRVSCRMYRGFRAVADGLGKILYPTLGCNSWLLACAALALTWLYLAPPALLVGWLGGLSLPGVSVVWLGAAIVLALASWILALWRFRYPWLWAFLYPVTIALIIALGIRSAFLYRRGKACWKGRQIRSGQSPTR